MATESEGGDFGRERLSGLADGEADAAGAAASCALWRGDAGARGDWHAWQLIGDVLRSDELASDAGHDAAFLAAFRARLAVEPVVLAPGSLAREPSRAMRWALPSAMAAGLVLAVGTFTVLRPGPTEPGAAVLAQAGAAAPVASAGLPAAPLRARDGGEAQAVTLSSQDMVRDPQLNRYLSAHKQFAGTSALGVPSVYLRSATLESPGR